MPSLEEMHLAVQPAEYQVVNYNIFPGPEIEFKRTFDYPITMDAVLCYGDMEIPEGFTSGAVQVLKPREDRVKSEVHFF